MIGHIASVLGRVLNWTYENISFHNYGFAIIVFTIMVRLILLPLAVKQHKVNKKMKIIQPKLDELKKVYGNDMQKYNMEVAKVYKEVGGNPLSGCLPALLQIPVMWSLLYVVGKPLTYMKGMSAEEVARWISLVPPEKRIVGFYEQIAAVAYNKLLNMDFCGMDLAVVPEYNKFSPILLLPILATIAAYLSTKVGMNNAAMDDDAKKKSGMFLLISPIITLILSFKFPAGLCIYWITTNLIQMVQQWYLDRYVKDIDEIKVDDVSCE